jgi:hypothetical protein
MPAEESILPAQQRGTGASWRPRSLPGDREDLCWVGMLGTHLGPQEPGQLSGDGDDHDPWERSRAGPHLGDARTGSTLPAEREWGFQ